VYELTSIGDDWRKGLISREQIGGGVLYAGLVTGVLFAIFVYWAYDDPFITYRYAENVALGVGFVYNAGERVLSTTTPLFALLLALLKPLPIPLPQLAKAISALSLSVGALCLWDLSRSWEAPFVGWAGLLLYPFFPLVLSTLGSETPLYIAFCLGAFAFYARQRYHWAALCAALAVLARADGILVPAVLGVDYLVRVRHPLPWRPLILFVLLLTPWFVFAWGYFGSPFPVTLAAKQHQGSMAISQKFAPGFLTIAQGYAAHWHYWLEAGLAVMGVAFVAAQKRIWATFLAWPVLYFAAYTALGVSRYYWYYAPLVPGFLVVVGLGLETLKTSLRRALVGLSVGVSLLLILALAQGGDALRLRQRADARYPIYRAVGEWLRANTPPEATVGTLEVGIIGYYARRPMIDFAGLIQPAVAERLTPDATYADAADWAIQAYHPMYLALNPAWFPTLMQTQVLPACEALQVFPGEAYSFDGEMVIYRCDWKE